MADVKVTSNASAVAADLRTAATRILDTLAAEVAEASALFREDLRGPSPGAGVTPFRTGNLQSSGREVLDGVRFSYINDARPYSPSNAEQGDRVSIKRGAESYAGFAHFAGAPEGQFADDAAQAFAERFGKELEDRAERALLGLMP
jgi:hypothetical protein